MVRLRQTLFRFLAPSILVLSPIPAWAGSLDEKLTELSNAGSAEAAYHLGMLYHLGLGGVSKDPSRAFHFFKIAADRGDPLGAYKVGCYYDGQGEGTVATDSKLALKYKMAAAEAGYALAQQDVAQHLFAKGDSVGGLKWLRASAAQGDTTSLLVLANLYSGQMPEGSPSLPKDDVKRFAYLLIAARDTPEMRRAFEDDARTKLAKDDYSRVLAQVAAWHEARSDVTKKADAGLSAAYILTGVPAPAEIPQSPNG